MFLPYQSNYSTVVRSRLPWRRLRKFCSVLQAGKYLQSKLLLPFSDEQDWHINWYFRLLHSSSLFLTNTLAKTNCITELLTSQAMSRAASLDLYMQTHGKPIGPLHGLPISVKE